MIEPLIKQQIEKGYALLLYDFKYDDLSRLAYNCFQKNKHRYPPKAAIYNLHLDVLNRSHRCNPLHPDTLMDITDAGEAARVMLLGMSMDGLARQGEFFIESSINFVKALIWFLRLYACGKYCTWPHVIELAQIEYKKLFTILRAEPQLRAQITPFVNALLSNATDQLEGQIATATISLSKLSSPAIYYIMSGNDFSLDLDNPDAPKILTIGGNPAKVDTYGPVISAYVNTISRLANRKAMYPLSMVFEEFSTVIVHTIARSVDTGRSNRMAITLCLQDASQLRLAYGKEFADVIMNTCANIIAGQVTGETARWLADRFGRTRQDRETLTATNSDLHISRSVQLEPYIPESRISSLSSGEFVGMVADNPDQPVELKTFCSRLINDPAALLGGRSGNR